MKVKFVFKPTNYSFNAEVQYVVAIATEYRDDGMLDEKVGGMFRDYSDALIFFEAKIKNDKTLYAAIFTDSQQHKSFHRPK